MTLGACNLFPEEAQTQRETPGAGGVLGVAIGNPGTLDPSKATSWAATTVLQNICEPLVTAHPATGQLLPGAAESWEISEDAKTITFELRRTRFHDGTEVEAADYVFSISRFVHKDTGSTRRFWLDRIAGYDDVSSGKTKTLTGITAPDERTLQIKAAQPFADLPAVLSHPGAGSALPKEAAEAKGFSSQPICTGPYQLAEPWDGKGDFKLVRSEAYVANNDAFSLGGRGFAEEIAFDVVANIDDGYQLLDEGKVEVAEVPVTTRLVEARATEGRVEVGPSGIVSYIGFPTHKGAFKEADYRRALAAAVDRGSIITDTLANSRLVPNGVLPPSVGPAAEFAGCELVSRSPDPEAAEGYLEESGVKGADLKFDLLFNAGENHERWLAKVVEGWEEHLGVTASLKGREHKALLDDLTEGEVAVPFRLAWPIEYPSPEAYLYHLFAEGRPDNFTRYSSKRFNEVLNAARAEPDDERRADLYAEAADLICMDAPVIVMWYGLRHLAFGETVVAAAPTRVGLFGHPVLRELGLRG